ncbi:MAG TPA: YraN family protein [Acidimicrobiia bacterium]
MSGDHRATQGRLAEDLAARLIEARGGKVEARNVRVGRGEVDLVARLGGQRVVVEVRSVSSPGGPIEADPLAAFDHAKAIQVRRLARDLGCRRVDLIAVRFDRAGVDLHWVADAA